MLIFLQMTIYVVSSRQVDRLAITLIKEGRSVCLEPAAQSNMGVLLVEHLRLYPRTPRASRFYVNLSAGESILLSRCRYFAQKEQKKFQRAKLSLPKAILDIVHRQLDSVLGLCFAAIDTLALGPIQLEKRYSCDQARRLVKRLQAKRLLVPCGLGPKRTICYVVFESPADQTTARLLRDLYEVELGQDRAPHLRLVPMDAEPLSDWSDRNGVFGGQAVDPVATPEHFCKGTPCRSARLSLIEDPALSSEPRFTKTLTDRPEADDASVGGPQESAVSVGVITNSLAEEKAGSTATAGPSLKLVPSAGSISVAEDSTQRRHTIHYRQKGWRTCACGSCETCELESRVIDAKAAYLLPRALVDSFHDRLDPERNAQLMRQLLDGVGAVLRTHKEHGGKPRYWPAELRIALSEDWAGNYRRKAAAQAVQPPRNPAPQTEPSPGVPSTSPSALCWAEIIAAADVLGHLRTGYLDPLEPFLDGQQLTVRAPNRWIRCWLESPANQAVWRAVLAAAPQGLSITLDAELSDQPQLLEQQHAHA